MVLYCSFYLVLLPQQSPSLPVHSTLLCYHLFLQLISICIEFVFICDSMVSWNLQRRCIFVYNTYRFTFEINAICSMFICTVSCNLYVCVCVYVGIDCAHLILVHLHIISNEQKKRLEKRRKKKTESMQVTKCWLNYVPWCQANAWFGKGKAIENEWTKNETEMVWISQHSHQRKNHVDP